MVTAPGAHSAKDQDAHEDVSDVDNLCVRLYQQQEENKDRKDAVRLEKNFLKAQRKAVSDALVPPPVIPPLPKTLMDIHYAAVQGRIASVADRAAKDVIDVDVTPHITPNVGAVEDFVGATRHPLTNLNGKLIANGGVTPTPAAKKARRGLLPSEDARELLQERHITSAATAEAFMAEIKHANDRKFFLELKKELIAKTIDQETFDQLKPAGF